MHFTTKIFLIIILLLPFAGNVSSSENRGISDLKEFNKFMLNEVNLARTRPDVYAEKRLKKSKIDGEDNGAYEQLKKTKPVKALKFNKTLNSVALEYAQFLAKKDKFGHEVKGTPFTRAKKAGYKYTAMGENLACGNDPELNAYENPEHSAIEFVKMLIIDKDVTDLGHRKTILNPIFKSVGFGFGYNPDSYCLNYVVQNFGNP